jgi:hypothetical protein
MSMTQLTVREVTRMLLLTFGALCCAVGSIIAVSLLCAPTEPGVVKMASTFYHGEPTNYPYVLWRERVVLSPEPEDWPSVPKAGGQVAVLAYGKGGTLKSSHALWRVWRPAAGFGTAGLVLLFSGLCIIRRRPVSQEIHAAPAI